MAFPAEGGATPQPSQTTRPRGRRRANYQSDCHSEERSDEESSPASKPTGVDPSRSLPRTGRATRNDMSRSLAPLGMTERGEGLGMTEVGKDSVRERWESAPHGG